MQTLDTKTIIINLLKEDKKEYLSFKRLQKLLVYIYNELIKIQKIDRYNTCFDVNFDAIERTVLYNNNLFLLDIDGEMIYLRKPELTEALAEQYKTDDIIKKIIVEFVNSTAA